MLMAKEINCVNCKKYLGTIEVGSVISKGLQPLCTGCHTRLVTAAGSWARYELTKKDTDHHEWFGKLFK